MQKRRKTDKASVQSHDMKILPVYCVCRSTDDERFMIACDRCEEWYHGDCISVTPKQAEQIKTFYCPQCRRKEPSLQIEYKSARSYRSRPRQTQRSDDAAGYADQLCTKDSKLRRINAVTIRQKTAVGNLKSERSVSSQFSGERKYCDGDPKVSPASVIDGYADCSGPSSPPLGCCVRNYWRRDCDQSKYDDHKLEPSQTAARMRTVSPRVRLCGSCSGCTRPEDCGKCDYCRDRRKFGGPNRMRQKCRLRQCTSSTHSCSHGSTPQSAGSRRRKQQTLQGVLPGSSPRPNQYTDFEDEPFEVPTDFSPRPYGDLTTSTLYGQHSASHYASMGSKMRRGDHIASSNEFDVLSRSYQRLPLDAAGDAIDFLDEDSDDDVIISGLPHCAGPACMSAPAAGGRYCSEACRVKHINSRTGFRSAFPRMNVHMNETMVPYNLPYPDHMYCRHHRVYSWHGNGSLSVAPYRPFAQSFDHFLDEPNLPDALHRTQGHSFTYDSESMHPASQRISAHRTSHTDVLSTNNRLSALDSHTHSVICDTSDTAAFMDSVESAMRRGVVPLVDDLDIELSHHPQAQGTHLSPSSLSNVNPYYTARGATDVNSTADLHHVEDTEDGLASEVDGDHGGSHANNHYYYMIAYNDSVGNRNPGTPLSASPALINRRIEPTSIRPRNLGNRLSVPDAVGSHNGIGTHYSAVRSVGISSSMRHSGLTSSTSVVSSGSRLGSTIVGEVSSGHTSVVPFTNAVNYIPGPDEFYTINDSDDLEINWPQESVPGVNV